MSDFPFPFPAGDGDDDELPEQMRRMMDAVSGQLQAMGGMGALFGAPVDGPVDWGLARRVALQVLAEGDRSATSDERAAWADALRLAEHWLDEGSLPAPPDAGRLVAGSRSEWLDVALTAMRPWIEPVAEASSAAMVGLAQQQLEEVDLDAMGLGPLAGMLQGVDLGAAMRPMSAMLSGMHAGQALGQLARQLLTSTELTVPTAPRGTTVVVVPNVGEAFGGWDLDVRETTMTLALQEAAHRRLFHAVPWLEGHLHDLVAQFAAGMEVDGETLQAMAQDLMVDVDPEDPASLEQAMERAGEFRLEPTPAQRRVLERLQGVLALVGGWARREVARVAEDRLPGHTRVDEVLRRRRAAKGDGEQVLERLLGLDLTVGDLFVAAVEGARGPDTLRRALAHPENLPDAEELADPTRWLERLEQGSEVPDDASALFGDLGDAPVEGSADERIAEARDDDGDDDGHDDPA
jgi:putative hydrolase